MVCDLLQLPAQVVPLVIVLQDNSQIKPGLGKREDLVAKVLDSSAQTNSAAVPKLLFRQARAV